MSLQINQISKTYGKTKALTDFSYYFDNGVYALLGPNGSGKSTLMNIITDNLKADKGNITFEGHDILKLGAKFREIVGFMPQYPGMYPAFSVYDFLKYIAELKDIDHKKAINQIDSLLKIVELSDVKKQKIKSLSGGMKQRLALVQALLGNPKVVILDEPTAGLDPKQRIIIRNLIAKIAFEKTVIIATHIVSDIEYISKEVIFLKKGVIIECGPAHELSKKEKGFVWYTPAKATDVNPIQQKYKVISIKNDENGIILRIISDKKPTDNSKMAEPTLEDRYLDIFGDIL